jgi:hypothetical protein
VAVPGGAPPLSIRLPQEDLKWLARFTRREGISTQALVNHAIRLFRDWEENRRTTSRQVLELVDLVSIEYENQVRQRKYFERAYRLQSRRLHATRRKYQQLLWQERNLRRRQQRQVRAQQNSTSQAAAAGSNAYRDALQSPTIAKLLSLAMSSESNNEAAAAFAKARVLYCKRVRVPH